MQGREQLLCIVTPLAGRPAEGVAQAVQAQQAALDQLLRQLGCVHFAALALLPPAPPGEQPGGPSLMLELAVEAGLPPSEMAARLVALGLDVLWPLYGMHWDGQSEKAAWLQRFLQRHVHQADGGFIGCRDRSVPQVQQEAALSDAVRAHVDQLPVHPHTDRRALAAHVAGWVASQPAFAWVQRLSPRGWWRAASVSRPRRWPAACLHAAVALAGAAVVLLPLFVLAGSLALLMALCFDLPDELRQRIFGPYEAYASGAAFTVGCAGLVAAGVVLLRRTGRLTVSAAATLLVLIALTAAVLLAVVIPLLGGSHARFFGALWVLLKGGAFVATAVGVAALAVVVLLPVALLLVPRYLPAWVVAAVYLVLCAGSLWGVHLGVGWVVARAQGWGWNTIALLRASPADMTLTTAHLLALLTGLATVIATVVWIAGLRFTAAALSDLVTWLDRPSHGAVPRAHQVHPSVEASDARLIGGPSHMISLTEIRTPLWLCRPALWLLLRFIGLVGHLLYTEGLLGTARGIHFAHWHIVDHRRLLFLSNYDGSFSGYLDEFILGASQGVNLIWRWTELRRRDAALPGQPALAQGRRFPPTRLGMFGGCRHEQWFKTYARDSMLPHLYRFSAYPYPTRDIQRATDLRDALVGMRTPAKDDVIMRTVET